METLATKERGRAVLRHVGRLLSQRSGRDNGRKGSPDLERTNVKEPSSTDWSRYLHRRWVTELRLGHPHIKRSSFDLCPCPL
jgi:hypothetical protein